MPATGNHQRTSANLLALTAESMLQRDSSFGDQCEMVLESCCMAHHRTKNCDSGKQFAKSGSACMDVELSKEASVATESFNDCCMSCSLGILAARTGNQTGSELAGGSVSQASLNARCKLISPLANSLSGQLYEQTYLECCQENLPKLSSALVEPGSPVDCLQANPCAQRCLTAGTYLDTTNPRRRADRDRCECFAGYKLALDEVNCVDIDECKLNLHSCNKQTEICDNTKGSFRCLARLDSLAGSGKSAEQAEPSGEFVSSRLCPLGFRWSSSEGSCQPAEREQRSASLQSFASRTGGSWLSLVDDEGQQ